MTDANDPAPEGAPAGSSEAAGSPATPEPAKPEPAADAAPPRPAMSPPPEASAADVNRRDFLKTLGAGAAATGAVGFAAWRVIASRAKPPGDEGPVGLGSLDPDGAGGGEPTGPAPEATTRPPVVIAKADRYDLDLETTVRAGLIELGLTSEFAKGKTVMLKPNLVEPSAEAPHVNTNSALVAAVAGVFRGWGAKAVFVAEGPGHVRDAGFVLDSSGFAPMLREEKLPFVDLNHDDVFPIDNGAGLTKMARLALPASLRRADIFVNMPKLKTHHWAVATLSMKNLFGIMPGVVYGWPKNVLHWKGIIPSIVDINATVRPSLSIIDGIVGMEGDGPIMGKPRSSGVIVMGRNMPSVDATACRVMKIDPEKVPYLKLASDPRVGINLGPVRDDLIEQRGEKIADVAQAFELIESTEGARLGG